MVGDVEGKGVSSVLWKVGIIYSGGWALSCYAKEIFVLKAIAQFSHVSGSLAIILHRKEKVSSLGLQYLNLLYRVALFRLLHAF